MSGAVLIAGGCATTIDSLPSQFKITTRRMISDQVPAAVPADAVKYGLMNFCGYTRDYQFLDRLVAGVRESIKQRGYARVNTPGRPGLTFFQVVYHRKNKHLEFLLNEKGAVFPRVYVVDLADVDAQQPTK